MLLAAVFSALFTSHTPSHVYVLYSVELLSQVPLSFSSHVLHLVSKRFLIGQVRIVGFKKVRKWIATWLMYNSILSLLQHEK